MMTAKLIQNDQNQAVCPPKEYRFNNDEVMVNKIGDVVMLVPKDNELEEFLTGINLFSK